jgi:hypothetical protein
MRVILLEALNCKIQNGQCCDAEDIAEMTELPLLDLVIFFVLVDEPEERLIEDLINLVDIRQR